MGEHALYKTTDMTSIYNDISIVDVHMGIRRTVTTRISDIEATSGDELILLKLMKPVVLEKDKLYYVTGTINCSPRTLIPEMIKMTGTKRVNEVEFRFHDPISLKFKVGPIP